ncbi:hypothetical protein CcaverHIS002_0702810 [Cutaneotrichosporon cavernicola]|uniref:Ricin B lectin domain-containing protein n=1 Tax=Cutaneotrichosporon cavernicola TaxID=279322 RepID=A0AA48LA86_9TREE|nr:uncharacterized protein CcaverHIS019_0702890 [Cutaneotrichosporon cavernicola]BEI86935.1 hypothetical protein CcaverHIS002_0702810 [Cutaneotrichosporon cavernicola]BEI94708.1 hypothetical protein CcaverHIS019_0702890 [Cutaneotrichosporon cavernicola]BEJ02483.1 hypothetical protein CcaverHIS631_0702780 [Cutaneotrichosporon cavernicola]
MLLLALTYLTLGVSAATMSWTNATLGNKWTAAQLNDSSFAKEEMLVRVHWAPPFCDNEVDTTSVTVSTTTSILTTKSTATASASASATTETGTNATPLLCIGAYTANAHNATPALVPCYSPTAALVFGTHHHIALGNGCLTAPSDPSNGFLVTIEDCDPDSEGQIWSWARHGSEWSFTHGDFCLDVMDGVYDVGTPLQVWECEEHGGNENQVFGFEKMLRIDYGDAEVYVDGITLSW